MSVRKNSPYEKQTEPQIQAAADSIGITKEQGMKILDHFFLTFREFLSDERMPTIFFPGFGLFRPTIGSIRRALRISFRLFKENKMPREIAVYRVRKFWPIRKRLIYEKNSENTTRDWYRVPTNWTEHAIKEDLEAANKYYYGGGKEIWDAERGIGNGRKRMHKTEI